MYVRHTSNNRITIVLDSPEEIKVMRFLAQRAGPDTVANIIKDRNMRGQCVESYQHLSLVLNNVLEEL